MANYETLKARQRLERDRYPENLSIRVHRALSWLQTSVFITNFRDNNSVCSGVSC